MVALALGEREALKAGFWLSTSMIVSDPDRSIASALTTCIGVGASSPFDAVREAVTTIAAESCASASCASPSRGARASLCANAGCIVDASAPEAERLIDENNRTDWISPVTEDAPAHVTIDFGRSVTVRGFVLKPAWHAPQGAGDPSRWLVRVGDAADLAGVAVETGEFSNIAANQAPQRLSFARPRSGRYLRIDFPRTAGGEVRLAIAELGLITR